MDYYNNNGNQFASGSNNDNRVNDFLDKLRDSGKLEDVEESAGRGLGPAQEYETSHNEENADVVIYNSGTASDTAELRGRLRSKSAGSSGGNKASAGNGSVKKSDAGNGKPKKKKKKKKEGGSRWWKVILKVALYMFCIFTVAICALTVWVAIYLADVTANDEELLDLNQLKLSYATQLMATDSETGDLIEYQRIFADENRIWVSYEKFPEDLKLALLAQEDHRFWDHDGVDLRRTAAAMLDLVLKELTGEGIWDETQGGSTITQQLVKNLTEEDEVDGEAGVMRKIREIYRAYQLERRFTKEQILEAYLNTFRLSGQVAGIEAAANYYFGVHTEDLTAAQSAAIVCITKAPGANNPFTNPETNKKEREDIVLWRMNDLGWISDAEYMAYREESEGFVFDEPHGRLSSSEVFSYFTDTAINSVLEDLTQYIIQRDGLDSTNEDDVNQAKIAAEDMFFNGGLEIHLTVDPFIQSVVEDVALNGPVNSGSVIDPENVAKNQYHRRDVIMEDIPLDELEKDEDGNPIYELDENGDPITKRAAKNQVTAAIVVMDYEGRLLGVAGGIREKTVSRGFSYAVDQPRQTGSSMKPLAAYCLPLEFDYITFSEGIPDKPADIVNGRPYPTNIDGKYEDGPISVAEAIEVSKNTIAVHALKRVGAEVTLDFLENNVGISTLDKVNDNGPTLALGALTNGITAYEMCAAYAIFGNDGTFTEKHCYTKIYDWHGNILIDKEGSIVKSYAISPQTAYIMNRLLQGVVDRGTGTAVQPAYGDNPANLAYAGKSGTTNDYKDLWFIGMNPYYVCAVWEGFMTSDTYNGDVRRHPSGNLNLTRVLFKTVMLRISYNLEHKTFQPDVTGISTIGYCRDSGDIATGACPDVKTGYYKTGHVPQECQHNLIEYMNEHTEDAPSENAPTN